MSEVTGLLKKLNTKTGTSRGKQWTAYSLGVDENGDDNLTWYSCGFTKPKVSEGQYVKFNVATDARGYTNVSGDITVVEGEAAAPAAAKFKAGNDSKTDSIVRQNATGHAVQLVAAMLEHDMVTVPAKNKRFDFVMALLEEVTDAIFLQNRDPKSAADIRAGEEGEDGIPQDVGGPDDDDYEAV